MTKKDYSAHVAVQNASLTSESLGIKAEGKLNALSNEVLNRLNPVLKNGVIESLRHPPLSAEDIAYNTGIHDAIRKIHDLCEPYKPRSSDE